MAVQTTPLLMRILSSSITVANRAGEIIRDIMRKGELGIIDKVFIFKNIPTISKNKKICTISGYR